MVYRLRKIALGLFACLALISFNACGDDDNDPTPEPTPTPEKVTASVSYEYVCTSDMLLMTDISVSYVNAEGKEVSEEIKDTKWKKDLTNVEVPFTAQMNVTYTKKEGFTPENEKYTFGNGLGISYKTSENKSENLPAVISAIDIPKDKVAEYLDKWITEEKKASKEIK